MRKGVLPMARWLSLTNDVFLQREALEDAPCGVLAWNREQQVVYVNRTLARLAGRDAMSLFHLSLAQLREELGMPDYDPSPALEGSVPPPKSVLLRRRDGSAVPAECTTHPIRSLSGETIGAVSFLQDLRDRLLGQQLRSVLDSVPEGIMVVTGQHHIVTMANAAAAQLLGLSAPQLIDRPLAELLPGDPPSDEAPVVLLTAPQGSRLRVSLTPLHPAAGTGRRSMVLLQDVQAAESGDPVMALARQTIHEIRNPLTVIYGFLSILARQTDAPQDVARLHLILVELERVNVLLQDFLDLAPLVPSQVPPCAPHPVVEEVLALYRPAAAEQGVTLTNDLSPNSPAVRLDPRHLKQLLHNLVRNALEAMDGSGTICVRDAAEESGSFLRVLVEDTGPGIAPEDLDRIFQPFFTTKKHGSGLGLPLCRQMLEQYGGALQVTSTPGVGTCFRLDLPLHPGGAADQQGHG